MPPEVSREESSEERGARGAGYRRGDGGVVGEGGPLSLPRGGNAPGESRGSALGEAGASGGDRDASQDASGSSRSPALMILMRTMARRARREHLKPNRSFLTGKKDPCDLVARRRLVVRAAAEKPLGLVGCRRCRKRKRRRPCRASRRLPAPQRTSLAQAGRPGRGRPTRLGTSAGALAARWRAMTSSTRTSAPRMGRTTALSSTAPGAKAAPDARAARWRPRTPTRPRMRSRRARRARWTRRSPPRAPRTGSGRARPCTSAPRFCTRWRPRCARGARP